MWRLTKLWNYKRAPKRRLVAGIILLGASERQEMKIHKTWSLCQLPIALRQSYRHLKALGTSHCQFSNSETHTTRSQKSWHFFAGRSLVLHGLVSCIALELPSRLWSPYIAVRDIIRMNQSDWSTTNVALGTKIEWAVDQTIFSLPVHCMLVHHKQHVEIFHITYEAVNIGPCLRRRLSVDVA